MDENNRNLLIATGLSMLVMLVWLLLFPPTPTEELPLPEEATADSIDGAPVATTPQSGETAGTAGTPEPEAAAEAPRVVIETPNLVGSLSLLGGRFDDLRLAAYRESLEPGADMVRLLNPRSEAYPYYAVYGWAPAGGLAADAVPGPNTMWELAGGEVLTPETPVELTWDNGQGLIFHRIVSVDDEFMFTVEQTVENTSSSAVSLAPYGFVARHGTPDHRVLWIQHEGLVRMTDGELEEVKYSNMEDLDPAPGGGVMETMTGSSGGWIGFSDTYWMTNLIPEPGSPFTSTARYNENTGIYQAEILFPTLTVQPGETQEATGMFFAGAKEWEVLRSYQNDAGIERFLDTIDWGWFFFLTKPIFWVLHHIHELIGNMGWSIIILTVILKALVFPLAYRSYVSMARMRELQPEMEKLKEKAGDDREKLQKGMMELYKSNKVNPASGCVPILFQIPIFFSLYKVIINTIELRHAPWIGWIRDLSAPDPSSILNLFGLLPYAPPDPGSIIAIVSLGVLPIFLGVSMWLQQKLNPAPPDPTQRMIFAWMPWVFMFMLGSFASGLVLYWITNNTITFIQQYTIMRLHGHKPDVFGNIASTFRRKRAEEAVANADSKPKGK
ncbi:membrane protein insertase YidC [Pseudoroseicyclus tamaricis]|uniref:Membrane protein insertase YidC n=1 Tax=Pseudoroseicyclus tamaricis TaxID=2705421 RepID=A0A6B2JWK9_9RHOB|nr:membrane protein insertase YidC [Pseudoroseicyclus tamaricis]NDU99751.1 membrane protein insertase YidC [Pseudoroseicyclus tamaricis]